jgi:diketogulonate reductase-like aldo/keto reductase
MSITRREFARAGLSVGAVLAAGGRTVLANEDLIRRPIPSSGETIPIVGVGTNRYGVGNDASLRVPLQAALARFHELGGTVIDTAPMYRSSESVLGDLIANLGVGDDLFMATKTDQKGEQANSDRLIRSLNLLQLKQIDLIQCHNLIDWETAIPLMREWKEEGRVRYIGVTSSRERQYELMEEIMRQHDLDFVQINYSLANQRRSADRILPLAADRGMAVLLNRPFGGGGVFSKLADAEIPPWAAEFQADSWGQFLLKYALSHPAVTGAIPGMTKERHVVDNMDAARGDMPTAADRKKMETFFDSL